MFNDEKPLPEQPSAPTPDSCTSSSSCKIYDGVDSVALMETRNNAFSSVFPPQDMTAGLNPPLEHDEWVAIPTGTVTVTLTEALVEGGNASDTQTMNPQTLATKATAGAVKYSTNKRFRSDGGDDDIKDNSKENNQCTSLKDGQMHEEENNENEYDDDDMSIDSVESIGFLLLDSDENEDTDIINDGATNMMRPFDMDLLKSSIQVGSEALHQITDRDVVLVVGKTGTGKSTLLQGLAGKTLRRTVHETFYNGQTVYKEVYEAEDPLPEFEIGHKKESKTKSIRCLEMEHNFSVIHKKSGNFSSLCYLDSPGLEDTDGYEMDIATSAMLSKVAKIAKSMRFCILIHCASLLEDRGGAIRSVLKFIRNFVRDFTREKQSFVFLFTHADEVVPMHYHQRTTTSKAAQATPIAQAHNDHSFLSMARKFLCEEIIRTVEVTRDEDARDILNFMHKCLKKEIPLVDILHPTETNFCNLRNTFQKMVKKISNPVLATNCGLTTSSRYKLEGEVKSQGLLLRHLLQQKSTQGIHADKDNNITNQIRHIREILYYLGTHLEIPETKNALKWCEDAMSSHCANLRCIVDDEINRGINLHQPFAVRNAESLRYAIRQLVDLGKDPPSTTEQFYQDRLKRQVGGYFESLLIDGSRALNDYLDISEELTKLKVWKDCFPTLFEGLYTEMQEQCRVKICMPFETLEKLNILRLEEFSDQDCINLVANLRLSESAVSHHQSLSKHLDIKNCAALFQSAKKRIFSIISEWNEEEGCLMVADKIDIDTLHLIAKRVRILDSLHSMMKERFTCKDICEGICNSLKKMETRIMGSMQDASENLMKSQIPLSKADLEQLQLLKDATQLFNGIKSGKWNKVNIGYNNVLNYLSSKLYVKVTELDKKTKRVEENGIGDGNAEGTALVELIACERLDDFFQKEDRFARNNCSKFRGIYDRRVLEVRRKMEVLFDSLGASPKNSIAILQSLFGPIQECHQIAILASIVEENSWISLCNYVDSALDKYSANITSRYNELISQWRIVVEDTSSTPEDVKIKTQEVNHSLGELEILIQLDPNNTKARKMQSEIVCTLEKISQHLKSHFEQENNYEFLVNRLHCVEAFGSFSFTSKHLPSIVELQQAISIMVSKDAKVIEDMVSTSSEWDEIDALIEKLEKAKVVDHFIGMAATSRLGPLLKLREQKELTVDTLLNELVASKDYKGISEFLTPLAKSKDQIKRQKFARHIEIISCSLKECIDNTNVLLGMDVTRDNATNIQKAMEILQEACKELGRYLKLEFDLDEHIKKLKNKINGKLFNVLNQASSAIERGDFHSIVIYCDRAEIFAKEMCKQLSNKARSKQSLVMGNKEKKIRSVQDLVGNFISSNFLEFVDLNCALSSLKKCLSSDDTAASQLICTYKNLVDDLLRKINELLQNLDSMVKDSMCYDMGIPILHALLRACNSGLNDHFDETALLFECEEKARMWQAIQRDQDREMDFVCGDAKEKLIRWSQKLDKLQSPGFLEKVKQIFRFQRDNSTYSQELQKLSEKLQIVFNHGKSALQNRDFVELESSMKTMEVAEKLISNHSKIAAKFSSKFRELSMNAFLSHCEQMQRTLEQNNFNFFEGLFEDYKGFLLNIYHRVNSEDAARSFRLVNQLVHETLSNQINNIKRMTSMDDESFDFLALKNAVEHCRGYGSFIADNFTLLHEELKNCEHHTEEKWLDATLELCHEHFSAGRDFHLLKLWAILGVPPSSSLKKIEKAYRKLAKKLHPDKNKWNESEGNERFHRLKDAYDRLVEAAKIRGESRSRPFDELLRNVFPLLRKKVSEYLIEQRYGVVDRTLFCMPNLSELNGLVTPMLNSQKVEQEITDLVKNHVCKVRTEVYSNWSARDYGKLNDNITDLKLMENYFKSYPHIFPDSWNTGIIEMIQDQISKLGNQAKNLINDKKSAKNNMDSFRRHFVEMGGVLVELPPLKDFTRKIMCDVLETCLHYEWGYSYLFEFGLSLQRGEGDQNENEIRIAHMVLAEFSHFKEVMTMAWNTETTQKPVEDTVCRIKGQDLCKLRSLNIDTEALLECYECFESNYKKLLGEYICPNGDLSQLVHKTKQICHKLVPVPCDGGWTRETKKQLSEILAAVFALFTIRKSGESFNRIEESEESSGFSAKILMKPHNIQVLTLLEMFGCGNLTSNSLDSQLLQIRTGEGKSMILGAAATVLALLGYRVRCVCYSEYLSNRDYSLFEDVFDSFELTEFIKYSKITDFSEDTTASKGDIRGLTISLLHGKGDVGFLRNVDHPASEAFATPSISNSRSDARIPQPKKAEQPGVSSSGQGKQLSETFASPCITQKNYRKNDGPRTRSRTRNSTQEALQVSKPRHPEISSRYQGQQSPGKESQKREEILLVDEVDVFFGADFYGQTYNQVAQLREPEVVLLLKEIWSAYTKGGRRQRLADIKKMAPYKQLVQKMHGFEFMIDNEISLMLDQVRRVSEVPYILNDKDKIGYKVMDSISYNVTYGYSTVFAYLKEAEKGRLKEEEKTLKRELCMNVSCGQFSYADISPNRILGVSGTLEAMGKFEQNVLLKYGIGKFLFMPSVYGQSNFEFQMTGEGIYIEKGISDFHQRLCTEILRIKKNKRAVIVFFHDGESLKTFEDSSFYRKLGRQKTKLAEDMTTEEKDFVIKKAATAGQLTICSAVFGRGTDFFCKDQCVADNGGVHIIQTFLSSAKSEEIQIQGRTARQGKSGTYQMILLDSDLHDRYGLNLNFIDETPKNKWYEKLCEARDKKYSNHCTEMERNLIDATKRDKSTHEYFDALLTNNTANANSLFKEIYLTMKKRPMPSSIAIDLCFIIDVTGSMSPYKKAIRKTLKSLLQGNTAITAKLKTKYPEINFNLRVATMAYRDIDDKNNQFSESSWTHQGHFTKDLQGALDFMTSATENPSGGFDLAEDHLGAIQKCTNWEEFDDWTSMVKFAMLFTDAPAHSFVPPGNSNVTNVDNYAVRHPLGLTAETVVEGLIVKEIDLFFCSFNPFATAQTEQSLAQLYRKHPKNSEKREITLIPMVPKLNGVSSNAELCGGCGQHIIFVLDQSGSMSNSWSGVVAAYQDYIDLRDQNQRQADIVSVIQFDDVSQITVQSTTLSSAPRNLGYRGGGTCYSPAAEDAKRIAHACPQTHVPVIVFMSDGQTSEPDARKTAEIFRDLNGEINRRTGQDLELHVIAFGSGLETRQLQQIVNSTSRGKIYTSVDTVELSSIFVDIAKSSNNVGNLLEAEIGKRISDAVSDKISLEYLG